MRFGGARVGVGVGVHVRARARARVRVGGQRGADGKQVAMRRDGHGCGWHCVSSWQRRLAADRDRDREQQPGGGECVLVWVRSGGGWGSSWA